MGCIQSCRECTAECGMLVVGCVCSLCALIAALFVSFWKWCKGPNDLNENQGQGQETSYLLDQQRDEAKTCILLGYVGVGKTYIFCKVCESKFLDQPTKGIVASKSYKNGYMIYDTPGFEKFINNEMLQEFSNNADNVGFNQVILVIDFENRSQKMFDKIRNLLDTFHLEELKDHITIIINDKKQSQFSKQDEIECRKFIESAFNIRKLIFFNDQSQNISQKIFDELDNHQVKFKWQNTKFDFSKDGPKQKMVNDLDQIFRR